MSQIGHIWQLLAAIMHLCHLTYSDSESNAVEDSSQYSGGLVTIDSPTMPLDDIVDLLGLFKNQFVFRLTTQQLLLRGRAAVETKVWPFPFSISIALISYADSQPH